MNEIPQFELPDNQDPTFHSQVPDGNDSNIANSDRNKFFDIFRPRYDVQALRLHNRVLSNAIPDEKASHKKAMKKGVEKFIGLLEARKSDLGNYYLELRNRDHQAVFFTRPVSGENEPEIFLFIIDGEFFTFSISRSEKYEEIVKLEQEIVESLIQSISDRDSTTSASNKFKIGKKDHFYSRQLDFSLDRSGRLWLKNEFSELYGAYNIFNEDTVKPIDYETGFRMLRSIIEAEEQLVIRRNQELLKEAATFRQQQQTDKGTLSALLFDYSQTSPTNRKDIK